jgi:di/tricarboxylate transporter
MMFYVAVGLASTLDVSPRPLIMAVTMAASLSFISPIGYQTNLMVMGPGGYRPLDYVRTGLPISLFVGTLAVILIPLIWPFHN